MDESATSNLKKNLVVKIIVRSSTLYFVLKLHVFRNNKKSLGEV